MCFIQLGGGHRKIKNLTTHRKGRNNHNNKKRDVLSSCLIFAALGTGRICSAMLIFYKNSKSYYPHAARPKIRNDTLMQIK